MKRVVSILLLLFVTVSFKSVDDDRYPVPLKNDKMLFYIQRNHNKNTIVYDANFDENGNLNKENPISVYWIRYEEQGQKMELRTIEKWYAYGVKCEKVKDKEKYYRVKLVADEEHSFWLSQEAPFKAVVYANINNRFSILDHLYIYADESGIWPKVLYVELFGNDIKSNNKVYEKLYFK